MDHLFIDARALIPNTFGATIYDESSSFAFEDSEFLQKLPLFKTAYSPLFETYVGIKHYQVHDDGIIIVGYFYDPDDGTLHDDHLFRHDELTRYCI